MPRDRYGLTQARLRELLSYDPESGDFRWRRDRDRAGNAKAGDLAGRIATTGYRQIRVDNRLYGAHRLAWLYMTGEWPLQDVDHRDRDRANNSWGNLRAATRAQNLANRGVMGRNRLGFKGVSRYGKGFRADIRLNGRCVYLGTFESPADAQSAYFNAASAAYGPFASV